MFEKSLRVVAESNHYDGTRPLPPPTSLSSLRLPRMMAQDQIVAAVPRKIYANAHAYHINSISVNSDGETYISADDLRINLWNLNISDQSFSQSLPSRNLTKNVLIPQPQLCSQISSISNLSTWKNSQKSSPPPNFTPNTVISSCTPRPRALSNWLTCVTRPYAISMQNVRHQSFLSLNQLNPHLEYEEEEDPTNRSFFSEIISSISDVKFSHDGRYILSRDYLTLKIWDVNMESRPVKTINIHDHLRGKLCDLYENDCIFDKFECVWNGDGT